jgi:hypothetical protein
MGRKEQTRGCHAAAARERALRWIRSMVLAGRRCPGLQRKDVRPGNSLRRPRRDSHSLSIILTNFSKPEFSLQLQVDERSLEILKVLIRRRDKNLTFTNPLRVKMAEPHINHRHIGRRGGQLILTENR